MINIQALPGLRVKGHTNLKKVEFTPEGQALGHMDWGTFVDPEYCSPSVGTICNRALQEEEIPINTGIIFLGQFENGPMAFLTDEDGLDGHFIRANPDAGVNPDAWTYFLVMEPAQNNTGIQRLASPTVSNDENGLCFNIGMNNTLTSVVIYETAIFSGGQPQRLRYAVPSARRGTRAFVMCTFSVREGLKIFWNGDLVAENRDDRRPLSYGYKAGEWELFRSLRGYVGTAGVLDVDMSEADYEGDRLTLEKFMMEKYNIDAS